MREGMRPRDFLQQFDKNKELTIPRADFYRGLASAGMSLSPLEMDTLMEVFAAPARRQLVDYDRFCSVAGEALVQAGLERAPLLQPVPHVPTHDAPLNFLGFEERSLVAGALSKLAKHPDHISNIVEVFKVRVTGATPAARDRPPPAAGEVTEVVLAGHGPVPLRLGAAGVVLARAGAARPAPAAVYARARVALQVLRLQTRRWRRGTRTINRLLKAYTACVIDLRSLTRDTGLFRFQPILRPPRAEQKGSNECCCQVNYLGLCNALDVLYATSSATPCWCRRIVASYHKNVSEINQLSPF